ncbi:peptidoglycan DD-metalloendopeptidase family protein [Brasilonema sp. UFV-L1]|uniref:peptidoglycan DD-metalloendopeptidase family protein n=1 Tax=Brasilonema sp. UFV-L1 TaxID=2234130 RepID=UPI00145EE6D6|nr:peptidoglycan DD-metalloendopeptidase family protein [Brasilonema sp. UFV-L1]NMG06632.1 peptidase M23 [Brasilonema sp. UFV-L1]
MKRALKKKVKAELENTPGDDVPVELIDAVNPRVNQCRVPTTAAMIGLAISMGATSLLVTRQSDQAGAAEALGNQKTASTIPASDAEVKFSTIKKLESQAVSSVSVPENPVVVEPTAISQVNELRAKWQVAASKMSAPTSLPGGIPNSPKATEKQSIAWEKNNLQQSRKQGIQTPSHANGIVNNMQSVSSVSAQPRTVESEVNTQLKAQQEYALNRLQEKSNRLRQSLVKWRAEESKNLSQQSSTQFVQPMAVAEKMPQTSTITATEQSSSTTSDPSRARLVSKLKQKSEVRFPTEPASVAVIAPATVIAQTAIATYEVKPGDTIGAIASDYGVSVSELVKANHLNNPHQLQISQKLSIPVAENSDTTPSAVAMESSPVGVSRTTNVGDTNPHSLIANNRSVTVPTPVLGNTQFLSYIQSTTANLTENNITNTQTSSTTTSYYGMGGDTPVPKVFTEAQLAQRPTATTEKQVKSNQRLRSLQLEIEKLREKYRSQQAGSSIVVPEGNEANKVPVAVPVSNQNHGAVPISVPRPNSGTVQIPVNGQNNTAVPILVPRPLAPNYGSQPGRPAYRANQRPANDPINPELLPNRAIVTPSMGIDASRSLGSLRGSTVSPQLPPLAAVDRYLPRPIDENTAPPSTSTAAYMWPAKGTLTSGYGWRWGRMHRGIDIANSTGTPIYASADGVVEKASWNSGGYGNLVDIRHPDGSMTRYGHNSKLLVQPGQQVRQGQTIALMGSTGFSTGPHTHFEIHPSGKGAVNPIALLSTARL